MSAQDQERAAASSGGRAALAEMIGLPWPEEIERDWPTPIAHELRRFRDELQGGVIASLLWQFKDLVEVLIRIPALVLASEVMAHGTPDQLTAVRSQLVARPITLGGWLQLLRDDLTACVIGDADRFRPACVAIALQFRIRDAKGKTTISEWTRLLSELVRWRNSDFGHGAFRLDPDEYLPGLAPLVARLNRHLATQVSGGSWRDVCLGTKDRGVMLTGASRRSAPAADPIDDETSLYLYTDSSEPLKLSPFIALRRCSVCGQRDIFCYDGRSGGGVRDAFGFADFAKGHSFTLPAHRLPDLARLQPEAVLHDLGAGDLDEAFSDTSIEAALDGATPQARYLTQSFLRDAVADFVRGRAKGILWIRAPGQTGKSTFVRALVAPEEMGESALLPDVMAAAFYIRREFRFSPIQFQEFLEINLARETLRISGRHRRIGFALGADDKPTAFADFLTLVMQTTRREERLLLCLDGLDEAPDGSEIIAFLPQTQRLPDNVFLLLTSRPLAECPPQSARSLARRPGNDADVVVIDWQLQATASDPSSVAYRTMLRRYFDREIAPLLLRRLRASLATFVATHRNHETLTCRDDLSKVVPPSLRERVRTDWHDLTQGITISSPPDAAPLATIVGPVLAEADRIFADFWTAAEGRFQFLAHLTRLYCDRGLSAGEISALSERTQLYDGYFDLIAQSTGRGKLWDLVQRLLVIIVAEDAVARWMRRESHQDWQRMDGGIDLADLAQRLGMNGRPAKLALLLFELKDVLLVTRASGHVAQRYHPGNFDIAMTISRRWPAELAATHRDRAGRGLELLAAPADAEALSDAELCGAIAHALLADLEHKLLDVNDRAGELLSARASAAHDESREHDAVALTSVGIALAERQLRAKFTLGAAWFLPVQLRHRAMAGLSMGRLRQASEDVDNAARLFESLRDMVDPRDRILIDREVAVTLGTRADIKTVLGDWHDALPDYGQAIELMTRGAGDGRLPDPRRPLATLLHNRARANGLCGADDKARADIDAAVALLSAAGDPDPVMLAQSLVLRSVAQWRDGNLDAAHLDARRAAGLVAPRPLDTDAVSADQLDIAASALGQFSRTSSGSGDYPGALRAAEEALRLRLALGERLGSAVTIAMQVGLANAYRDRGLALINLGRRDAGFADIDTAVALGEAAGRAAGEDWEPNQREALGALYSARAMFLHRAGDPARVRADLARADELGFDARLLADTAPDLAHLLEQIHKHPS